MEYLLLIAEEEGIRETWSEENRQADMEKWFAYTKEIGDSGVLRDGKALHPTSAATTVRVQADGQALTTEGRGSWGAGRWARGTCTIRVAAAFAARAASTRDAPGTGGLRACRRTRRRPRSCRPG